MSDSVSHSRPAPTGISGAYVRLMDRLSMITAVIAGSLLGIGVLTVCHMVFVRYVLGESTVWQTEFTTYAISSAMLLGAPYVLLTGGHVAVTVLSDSLKGAAKKTVDVLGGLCGIGFCLALTYGSWIYVHEAWSEGWTTGTVWNPPLWPAIAPMAIGATMLSLQYVAEFLRGGH